MPNVADYGYTPDFINQYMQAYSEYLGFPSNYLQAIAEIESSYNPYTGDYSPGKYGQGCNAIGACGMMQIMPIAETDVKRRFSGASRLNKFDPFHAVIMAAMLTYLNKVYFWHYINRVPQWDAFVVAYNGGIGAGLRYVKTGAISNESRNYVALMSNMVA